MKGLKKNGFEFLSIFIAVISAFALNNWNDNRRDSNSENKILTEIYNGLDKDILDIKMNVTGHKQGLAACSYFRKILTNQEAASDSLLFHFLNLTRDFVAIQNTAGYETLKSKGLELIKNDSLRLQIISNYEFNYNVLEKLEEEYNEIQFHENYFKEINRALSPHFLIDSLGHIQGIYLPVEMEEYKRNELLSYLWKIETNRKFILNFYELVLVRVEELKANIQKEISA